MANWSRHELLVAFHLYCEVPFGKIHHRNPVIVEHAEKLGRTPSALALKLTNIASLDPAIRKTGRTGMQNVSAADREMWEEMNTDWDAFAVEAHEALQSFEIGTAKSESSPDILGGAVDYTSPDAMAETKIRLGQRFFRQAVLSAYNFQCCVSGLAIPDLLVASHIVPWRQDAKNRLNPRNGLCLSALHDRAFDTGIMTISEDMTVLVSARYQAEDDSFFRQALLDYDGRTIALPDKFPPAPEFLAYHRQHVFQP